MILIDIAIISSTSVSIPTKMASRKRAARDTGVIDARRRRIETLTGHLMPQI